MSEREGKRQKEYKVRETLPGAREYRDRTQNFITQGYRF